VAGCRRRLFTDGALRRVHSLSGGVPRLINTICDRALLGAYAKKLDHVNRHMVGKAAVEVTGPGGRVRPFKGFGWASAVGACLLLWVGWEFFLSPMIEKQRVIPEEEPASFVSSAAPKGPEVPGPGGESEGVAPTSSVAPAQSEQESMPSETLPKDPKADAADTDASSILDTWFQSETPPTDMDTAFAALFQEWRTDYPVMSGVSPCEGAAKAGLRCYRDRGNWTTLRHLNRPVILELVDPRQRRHYVAVVRLEDRAVTLHVGDQDVILGLGQVEPFWLGDFTLLWKPPALAASVIKEGDRGPHVLWLRAQLARAEGSEDPAGGTGAKKSASPVFDEELKHRVMAFQQAHFVKADGIVGEQTLIQLNRAAPDAGGPLLYTEPTDGERHVANP